jgi:hypothetical protein
MKSTSLDLAHLAIAETYTYSGSDIHPGWLYRQVLGDMLIKSWEDRRIVRARYIHRLTLDETAQLLGQTPHNIQQQWAQLFDRLSATIGITIAPPDLHSRIDPYAAFRPKFEVAPEPVAVPSWAEVLEAARDVDKAMDDIRRLTATWTPITPQLA